MWLPNTFAILGVAREQDPEQEIKDMGLHLNSWSLLRDMRAAILKEGKKKKKRMAKSGEQKEERNTGACGSPPTQGAALDLAWAISEVSLGNHLPVPQITKNKDEMWKRINSCSTESYLVGPLCKMRITPRWQCTRWGQQRTGDQVAAKDHYSVILKQSTIDTILVAHQHK